MQRRAVLTLLPAALAGCAMPEAPEARGGQAPDAGRADVAARIVELERDILALSGAEGIAPEDAARAARIAVTYPLELRARYGVTDPPLVHNTKVNLGFRDRGLCWHWADDLQARLAQEGFQTLDLHRAIANATSLRIDHSTVVISARGAAMEQGLVLDPWRQGGVLFWAPVLRDPQYTWERRARVMARRR